MSNYPHSVMFAICCIVNGFLSIYVYISGSQQGKIALNFVLTYFFWIILVLMIFEVDLSSSYVPQSCLNISYVLQFDLILNY